MICFDCGFTKNFCMCCKQYRQTERHSSYELKKQIEELRRENNSLKISLQDNSKQ